MTIRLLTGRHGDARWRLLVLGFGGLAACTPGATPVSAAGASPRLDETAVVEPPQPACAAEPAVCAEQQRKRDELLKPPRQRVHPAGETPPTRAPTPEQ